MYTVKFTPYRKRVMFNQTRGGEGYSSDGRYKFLFGDDVREADFWVVQGKGIRKKESCRVARENTILLTTEPRSVLVYPHDYTRQFGMVYTSQTQLRHPNVVLGPPALPWFIAPTHDYDTLTTAPAPEKTKLISVITSDKAFTRGHLDRIAFVMRLKERYGNKIDLFGRGINDFEDKWDVLAPYKYHVVIENSSVPYYWTEKLSDCYLTRTLPIYYGCTNVGDYFPREACEPIDIADFDGCCALIDRLIAEDAYASRKEALDEAHELVLGKYNLFDLIASLCDRLNPEAPKPAGAETALKPCVSMHDWENAYNYLITRSLFGMEMKLKGLLKK